ncbi:hypothetical protein N7447_011047 [Penicillium robsamsonii]|uniref:uncharacterized protein n=1 Tax=Penicillium robsamsonii TaxID=1792511 RepID=UPI0025479574|nr:uncharacterized protein N7447_011047 [Penicillium robsamsonii]KAJ5807591.1 hypothetical protein N7447_011047 [Penicillium robsamsonii]
MFPVLEHEEILEKWPDVRRQVLDIHEVDLVSVGCCCAGRNDGAQNDYATVLTLEKPRSRIDWKDFRDDGVKIIDRLSLPMVAVETSTADHPSEKELEVETNLDSLHRLNKFYQSVAPRVSNDAWGALAGFIELLGLPDGKWMPFILTCYHCTMSDPLRDGIIMEMM